MYKWLLSVDCDICACYDNIEDAYVDAVRKTKKWYEGSYARFSKLEELKDTFNDENIEGFYNDLCLCQPIEYFSGE